MKYIIVRATNCWYTHVWKIVEENKETYELMYVGKEFPFYCELDKRKFSINDYSKSLVVGSIKMVEYE